MHSQKRPIHSVHGTDDRSILVFWCVLVHVFSTHGIPWVENTCILNTWDPMCWGHMYPQHNVFSCSDTCIFNTWDPMCWEYMCPQHMGSHVLRIHVWEHMYSQRIQVAEHENTYVHVFSTNIFSCSDACILHTWDPMWDPMCWKCMWSQHNVFSCSDACTLNTDSWDRWSIRIRGNQNTATHCNTLQHTATHCYTLQHTATHCNTLHCLDGQSEYKGIRTQE